MRRRSGKSLVELLVVVTLISGALGLSAVTLTALFRTETRLRRDREQQLASSRLADLWRADAHAATACEAGQECVFTLADGRATHYTIKGPRVWREVRRGDQTMHRDSFPLSASAAVAFASQSEQGRTFAVLSIRPQGGDRAHAPAVRPATIAALINLHGQPRNEGAKP